MGAVTGVIVMSGIAVALQRLVDLRLGDDAAAVIGSRQAQIENVFYPGFTLSRTKILMAPVDAGIDDGHQYAFAAHSKTLAG
ncbi:MAG: hypothetical protein BWY83_02649 [bacterium ADurb.Bin478]|nr:MAG: hypothetical protein BWY83_02649 [bacterium ADurb.Bin478]